MLSSNSVPQTMLSPSFSVPQTMLSSVKVPHTMLSQSVSPQVVPQTMLSPSASTPTPQSVPTSNAFDPGTIKPPDTMWLPQIRCLLHMFWTGTGWPDWAVA